VNDAVLTGWQVFWLVIGAFGVLVFIGLLIMILGILLKKTPAELTGGGGVYNATVFVVIYATILLTLAGVFSETSAGIILGTVAGYVLVRTTTK